MFVNDKPESMLKEGAVAYLTCYQSIRREKIKNWDSRFQNPVTDVWWASASMVMNLRVP
jgi:hypothetical protein